jgi:hypothetical protein
METDVSTAASQQSYRLLWVEVVLQAKSDLENEPIGSLLYEQAAAFFVNRGEWAVSRATVADCLEVHPDDLRRCGERWIAERRIREGLPSTPAPTPQPKMPLVLPRLEAIAARDSCARNARPKANFKSNNPFNPFRFQPEASALHGA